MEGLNMESLNSAFSDLPYFNPMMMVNTSGLCAATRLIQCRYLGVSTNDISRKFHNQNASSDLSDEEFMARKKILKQLSTWCNQMRDREEIVYKNEFAPILYRYEIVKGSARRARDWGDVVFTDMTTTRFLLVMVFPEPCNCGDFSHHDYNELTKYQANRFFSLAKYIYHSENQPNWVRATYVTKADGYNIDPLFFRNMGQEPADPNGRIFLVNNDNFAPSLLESDVERIDNLRAQSGGHKAPTPADVRQQVIGSKEARPNVQSKHWKQKNARQCALCQVIKEKDLKMCSRCKLVYYCGPECQKLAWPNHKIACKKAQA